MWAHAATRSSRYSDRAAQFYRNARMHLEHDEMQGDGLNFATVAHVQAWALITIVEAETPVPARAYMSNKRAVALCQLLGLHQIDNANLSSRQSSNMLQPPQDFVEAEERRRTFWYIYFSDCWAGSGTGQTPSIKDEEITTLMPSSEYAFREGHPETAQSLQCATSNGLEQSASSMGAAVVSGWILEQCSVHLRQASDVKDHSRERQFWLRHQQLDNIISRILMNLPDHLRAAKTREPLAVFVNMCLHQFTISLFQAAIKLAQKSPSRYETVARLRLRVHRAAENIIDIMRAEAGTDVKKMCPFIPSCLYVAATVYINDLSSGYEVEHAQEALLFIVHTIKLFRKYWRAAQMMLAQILHNLKDCNIDLDATPADATALRCFSLVGEDFDALGPLFATDTLLGELNVK
ncbi:hypothetical protein LTR70_002334 [Exophiala xenobiotica]|nr:hypothetical protein LTR70_002334 [Exophiala xenobiotica]